MDKRRYLIVGAGIAGCSLAYELLKRNISFLLVDSGLNSASLAANAIINPVTGRRLVKTWLADSLMPFCKSYYAQLQNDLSATFYRQLSVFKLIHSHKEENEWLGRSADLSNYVSDKLAFLPTSDFSNSMGCLEIKPALHINPAVLFAVWHKLFASINSFKSLHFSENELEEKQNAIFWNDCLFEKVVFCRGAHDLKNKFFSWLPFRLAKGQALRIEKNTSFFDMISSSVALNYYDEQNFFCGSTHEWDFDNASASEAGEVLLKSELAKFFLRGINVKSRMSAIRPTTTDYRPFIGGNCPYFIFNGFGTKGFSLAPYFASCMIDYCEGRGELLEEISIARHR